MGTTSDLTGVIRHLRVSAEAGDPELLARYARARDQAAFEVLVRRYGPLVLGVARRQLADRHRAEDVFQATFLALARSAAKLGSRPVLASWLYTVAIRQSRKARAGDARRAVREHAAPRPGEGTDPLDEITARELLRAVDDELARLPDRLRLPVLLCCVQGLSREEAAARLGVSQATVRGRLERGRRRLAARLTARGLAPSALVLAPLAAVSVPADLFARTAEQTGDPWARGVPAAVADLAATAPRGLLPAAAIAGCVLAVGLAAWAAPLVAPTDPPAEQKPAVSAAALPVAAPVPPAKPDPADPLPDGATVRFGSSRFRHPATIEGVSVSADGRLAVAHSGTRIHGAVRTYDLTTGRVLLDIESPLGEGFVEGAAVSPDGKTLAIKRNFSVYLYDAAAGKEISRAQYPRANPYSGADLLVFAPDGQHVAVAAAEGKAIHLIGLARGEVLRTFPHAHVLFAAAFSPDGKHLVAGGYDSEKGAYFARLWDAESGKELHRLTFGNGGIRCVAYAPDGKTVAVGGDGGKASAVKLFDPVTGKETRKIPFPDASSVKSVAFSPDGKTLAASGGSATRLFDT
ncbi:MAG: sigma-70 family RNA polymerase sigma factor, partial [Planctomycetes bacterium]|nr:sigma-70 family RNA polymerase sigma factor [Planctomycetota bacterium]